MSARRSQGRLADVDAGGRGCAEASLPPAGDLTDAMLHRARAGDVRALEQLLAALRPRIVAAAQRYLIGSPAGRELAEDVAQDTLLRVANSLHECEAESLGQFVAWTFVIVRRRVLDERRRRLGIMDPARRSLPANSSGTSDAELVSDGQTEAPNPTAVERALLAAVFDAYNSLGDSLAEIVWLRLVHDAGWPEIAHAMGTTPGAAKRRYQRAVGRMRRITLQRLATVPRPLTHLIATRSNGSTLALVADMFHTMRGRVPSRHE